MLAQFNKLLIVSVTAIGDLFALQIDHVKMSSTLSDRAHNLDVLHEPDLEVDDVDEFGAQILGPKNPEDRLTMSEFCSPFW